MPSDKPPSAPQVPGHWDGAAALRAAIAHHRAGRLDQAASLYRQVLERAPASADAMHLLGVVEQQRGNHDRAVGWMEASLRISGAPAAPWSNLGVSQHQLGRLDQALASFDQALQRNPDYFEGLVNRGNLVLTLRGPEQALLNYDRAAELQPGRWEAHFRRAVALATLRRYSESLSAHDRVLVINPGHHASVIGRGNALSNLRRPGEALECYDLALQLVPAGVEVLNNRGSVLRDLKRYREAAESFARLAAARPEFPYVRSNQLHSQLYACDWTDYDKLVGEIAAGVDAGRQADVPFSFLAICDSPAAQLKCAQRYVKDYFPASPMPTPAPWPRHARLRIAYLSSDFHAHATSYLMAGMFECHDRQRFEVLAISFGPESHDDMRTRLLPCFDEFIDARLLSDQQVAALIRDREVDIAIDLKGFTTGNRAAIFAQRPAPIQVGFLGYPGSMGADYIDYLIADEVVAPMRDQPHYAEQLVHLPGSYQVNDSRRKIAPRTPSRAEVGLPAAGFVFCCFNNNYKITPAVFAIWMRLLDRVSGSVLWLLEDNADAANALRLHAEHAGIAPGRLVFAPRVEVAEHLARHRLADLFLDTLPCNAHTTASDALWAGLPVLTCMGRGFASRVGASLVTAVGLPELACQSLEDYEASALRIATTPSMLEGLRAKLASARTDAPLFDTLRFTRNIEAAYLAMQSRTTADPAAR